MTCFGELIGDHGFFFDRTLRSITGPVPGRSVRTFVLAKALADTSQNDLGHPLISSNTPATRIGDNGAMS